MAIVSNPQPSHWRDQHKNPVLQIQRAGQVAGARRWSQPADRRPLSQIRQRFKMYEAKITWDNFTIGQKNAWSAFASTWSTTNKYGDTIMIGGYQWFLRFSLPRLYVGLSAIITPPDTPNGTYTPTINVSGLGSGFPIEAEISPFPTGLSFILVQRRINLPIYKRAFPSPLLSFGTVLSSSSDPFVVSTASETDYNQKVFWFGFHPYDSSGRPSDWQYIFVEGNP